MTTAIWWLRRDLRLTDNQALHAARRADHILPLFILDPALLSGPRYSPARHAFLLEGLRQLDADLRARGSYLILRQGHPASELARLRAETGAEIIYAEEDYTPYARRRDHAIAQTQPLHLTPGLTIHYPEHILKSDGKPYVIFTPYSRAWQAAPLPQRHQLLTPPPQLDTPTGLATLPIPTAPARPDSVPFPAGEAEAQRRLAHFSHAAIYGYRTNRDRLDLPATSTLSPYLRFGMLSARQACVAALAARAAAPPNSDAAAGAHTWLNELIWREFYQHILYHFPHVRTSSFNPKYAAVPWENDPSAWAAWRDGQTGYPVIDAAMRQLSATGWMPNRARMLVAAFLVKDLFIDWRWGERWFMCQLVDGDLAANNGGWQWSAGTGVDAAPYFRIFNPVTQAGKFDPNGDYIRAWVPELAHLPRPYLYAPWIMPAALQRELGCVIGRDYPAPIVDHQWARERILAAYRGL